MNQVKIIQIRAAANKILKRLDEGSLTDTTYANLINECHLNSSDFYMALGWLAKENKIVFLKTQKETYVYPLDN